jgi:tetratricopeptide (TPR) repeat protein
VQLECAPRTRDHLKIRAVTELRQGSPDLYLGDMKRSPGIAFRWSCACVVALWVVGFVAAPAHGEEATDDAAGRAYFERGREAFEHAEYESALIYFRHAYQLSRRGELQYNIGVAADRLQREEEALKAFERYLDETKDPTREEEVRERIDALEQWIAKRKATELALEQATIRYHTSETQHADGARLPKSTIIGASALGAIGVAGVAAMGVGLAKDGSCKREVSGNCVVEHSATSWTYVYGALGAAALAGSATWFAITARRAKNKKNERETALSITPMGVVVSGKF